ncbi:MAG: uroporphyrinogen decarboxylase [Bergeyella sp.]|nr:uroporphyrinogen decarboxylase [Bergeyella sp.]
MDQRIINSFGYAASVFIILSFLVRDVNKIRVINLIGCVFFVLYGVFNGYLWPVIIPNAILCFVQLYHILRKDLNR